MIIRNSIIIIDEASPITMTPQEMADFTGNRVIERSRIPADLLKWLEDEVRSADSYAVSAETRRPLMDKKTAVG